MSEPVSRSRSQSSRPIGVVGKLLKGLLALVYKLILPVLIVAGAMGFYKYQMDTRPEAQRRLADRQARLVTVDSVHRQTRPAVVHAMGTVKPATEVALTAEVTGIVTDMDPAVVPGGLVKQGQILYRIDSRDYETIVQQRQSDLARAELALRLEQANQTVARQEFELLGEMIEEQERELVLREPHLAEARRALEAAKAALAKAELDVRRCTVRAPFNAVIKAKHADVGARVSPTTPLAVLTGTDEYWVELLVPIEQLRWIQFPDRGESDGSPVRIYNSSIWREGQYRQGRVLRLMGQLEEAGRMARMIVSVPDPLGLRTEQDAPLLLIGSYVRAEIQGREIPDVIVLPREYLRDGEFVWVMNEQGAMEIRRVEIVYRGREAVYVTSGLSDGDRVVSSDLSAPVEGMPLRVDSPPLEIPTMTDQQEAAQ